MKQERAHQHYSTLGHRTDDFPQLGSPFRNIRQGDTAQTVARRDDTQRPMILRSVVEMHTYGKHARQDLDRRLDVRYAVLEGPWAEPLDLLLLMHGDGEILVPRNLPVRFGVLVESCDLDRPCPTPQDLSRQSRGRTFGGERSYRVRLQAKASDSTSPVLGRRQAGELSSEQDDLILGKSGLGHRITV
jgi:hypothetical protein